MSIWALLTNQASSINHGLYGALISHGFKHSEKKGKELHHLVMSFWCNTTHFPSIYASIPGPDDAGFPFLPAVMFYEQWCGLKGCSVSEWVKPAGRIGLMGCKWITEVRWIWRHCRIILRIRWLSWLYWSQEESSLVKNAWMMNYMKHHKDHVCQGWSTSTHP